VTPFVCYDLRFADDFWITGPGTDLFLVVANWPASRRRHWSSLLVARAIENQCYVVGVNRVGTADGLVYSGDSAIIDPAGDILVTASGVETVLTADVDAATVTDVRTRFPFLQDRR
jgi:predicted amidohydrolase